MGSQIFEKCGTPGYIAPEVFLADKYQGRGYSFKVDIFSAGLVFFNLLTGYYLFRG
jgi:calcium/calmodulin-dependent protein kinase I